MEILREGVYVEFDTVGKENYMSEQIRVKMSKKIEESGFENKVFLSMDITRRSHLKAFGGIGYSYLLDTFVPMMKKNNISERFIQKMLIDNPMKFYN